MTYIAIGTCRIVPDFGSPVVSFQGSGFSIQGSGVQFFQCHYLSQLSPKYWTSEEWAMCSVGLVFVAPVEQASRGLFLLPLDLLKRLEKRRLVVGHDLVARFVSFRFFVVLFIHTLGPYGGVSILRNVVP